MTDRNRRTGTTFRTAIAMLRAAAQSTAGGCYLAAIAGLVVQSTTAAEVRLGISSQATYVGIPVVQQAKPIPLVAPPSETGDLLFVEVARSQDRIYVGQPLQCTLRIWLKPYRDQQRNIVLSEGAMWYRVTDETNWGEFSDRMDEIDRGNQRPRGREVLRADGDGFQRRYYQYELDTTIYPQRPGNLDADDVRVVMNYPTEVVRSRSLWSFRQSKYLIVSSRPIVGQATVEPIVVKPIPTAGRPADYQGAVGQYRIRTEATPTHVKAGDPIQLNIGIAGTGPMDLVQAPPLSDLTELTTGFRVPSEPLAGFVKGDRKGFSTSIRPRRAGITQVPGIPFSYFDPDQEKFVSITSQPISIHVEPADMLAMDAIVQRNSSDRSVAPNTAQRGLPPVLENYAVRNTLTSQKQPDTIPGPLWVLLALPPLLVMIISLTRSGSAFKRHIHRLDSPVRACKAQLGRAKHPVEIANAVQAMFAHTFPDPGSATGPAATVGRLRAAGYRDLAIQFQRIFDQCTKDSAGGAIRVTGSFEQLKAEAVNAVTAWDTRKRSPRELATRGRQIPFGRRHPTARFRKSSRRGRLGCGVVVACAVTSLAGLTFVAIPLHGNTPAARDMPDRYTLTKGQQTMLLAEANQLYEEGRATVTRDAADAKQAFSLAADKYQMVVDSGVRNGRLYTNLANARLQCGQLGLAIANYHRALKWEPTNRSARTNLTYAQQMVGDAQPQVAPPVRKPLWDYVAWSNDWLNRYLPPQTVLGVFVISWYMLWGAVGCRLFGMRLPWKTLATVALMVCTISAASFWTSHMDQARHAAVILVSTVDLREGDGHSFPVTTSLNQAVGRVVKVLDERGSWVRVMLAEEQSGWLPRKVVEPI